MPSSFFVDNNEVKEVISDLLVEYGRDQLNYYHTPVLEFDEDSGKMCASRYDIERAEEELAGDFREIISEVKGLQDVIDVWDCVAEVDVKDFYTTDCDGDNRFSDNSDAHDYGARQIDDMFANLIHDV